MKFVREIPIDRIKNDIFDLEQFGFTLIWLVDSVEVWADC